MQPPVTIRERVDAAFAAHAYAYSQLQQAVVLKQAPMAAFWRSICDACMDEIDECAAALACHVEPLQAEILKGNTDIHCAP